MFHKSNKGYGRHGSEYSFVRFTKTLPIIKYSENMLYNRHRLDRPNEVVEERESRFRSKLANAVRNLPNGEAYLSYWSDIDTAASSSSSSISGSINMDNLISFDTIPLQLNVPKQDRSALYKNNYIIPANDQFNEMTPPMTNTDSDIVTPDISPNLSENTSVTPIYCETRLDALKIHLEEMLHEMERTSKADKKSELSSSYSSRKKQSRKKQSRKKKKQKERKMKKKLSTKRKDKTPIKSVSDQLDYILSLEKRSAISFELGNCKLYSAKGFIPAAVQKLSPINHRSRSFQSDHKMHSPDFNSIIKPISSKHHNSPLSLPHRSPRYRKNSSHRSRKRARKSSKRRRSSRKSPRSPSSSRSCTTPTLPKKPKSHESPQTNRKWEPESVNLENQNFEFEYDCSLMYSSLRNQSSTHDSFDLSDELCDFHPTNGVQMSQLEYSKMPILNSESFYFQSPTQLSEPTFSNLIEICQSNSADMERPPFVLKGNILEIIPSTESVVSPPCAESTLLNDVSSKLDERIGEMKIKKELIEQRELKKDEIKLKRKQELEKKHLERFMRKEKLRLEIETLKKLCAPIPGAMKATLNRNINDRKKIDTSSSKNENVSSSVGIASGDKTTKDVEDTRRLMRDSTIEKSDSIRCRAEKKATIIKKEMADEILSLIDSELENMPPPLPPDGSPPPNLLQPKLKFVPKSIYFHYNLELNTIQLSSDPTPNNIPKTLSPPTIPTDSQNADNSAIEQCSAQKAELLLASQQNKYQQSPSLATYWISSNRARTLPPKMSFTETFRKPKSSSRHPPCHPQSSAMILRNNSLSNQMNTQTPCTQKQPLPQIWESNICFPRHVSVNCFNNIPPQTRSHIPWEQQQQQLPSLFEISVHLPESSLGNIYQHPGSNHPMFYENQSMNFNLAQEHQQQNDFKLNSSLNFNMHPNKQLNHKYRNNY